MGSCGSCWQAALLFKSPVCSTLLPRPYWALLSKQGLVRNGSEAGRIVGNMKQVGGLNSKYQEDKLANISTKREGNEAGRIIGNVKPGSAQEASLNFANAKYRKEKSAISSTKS